MGKWGVRLNREKVLGAASATVRKEWGLLTGRTTVLKLAILCSQGPNGPQGPTGFPGPKGPPVSTAFSHGGGRSGFPDNHSPHLPRIWEEEKGTLDPCQVGSRDNLPSLAAQAACGCAPPT